MPAYAQMSTLDQFVTPTASQKPTLAEIFRQKGRLWVALLSYRSLPGAPWGAPAATAQGPIFIDLKLAQNFMVIIFFTIPYFDELFVIVVYPFAIKLS